MAGFTEHDFIYDGRHIDPDSLPALPAILHEAHELVQKGNASPQQIGAIFAKDQALSAKILKIINSPVYGFSGRISSITNALTLLGFNVIRNIIITAVAEPLSHKVKKLWVHSYACSLACGVIAKELRLQNAAEFIAGGLLHDFGKAVIVTNFPDAHEKIDALVREKDISFIKAEKEILGFTHTQVNDWVATQWKLPVSLKNAMVYHHQPNHDSTEGQMTDVVHLGDFFTRLFEQGSGGDENVSALDFQVLQRLNITVELLGNILDALGEMFNSEASRL